MVYFFKSLLINIRYFIYRTFFLVVFLFLQSCHYDLGLNGNTSPSTQRQAEAASYNTQLGLAYLQEGQRPRAKQKLLKAYDQAPDSPNVNAAMGFFFEKTGDVKKATEFFDKALSLAPHDGIQLNNYGAYLCRQKHYADAEGYFLKAVKDVHYVNSAGAYENAGLCVAQIAEYKKAIHYFKQALKQDPSRKQSIAELLRIEMKLDQPGKALALVKQYDEQIKNDHQLTSLAMEVTHRNRKNDTEIN